jgi:hypothetical protein
MPPVAATPGWTSYLPSSLQLPQLYFAMAVGVATVCACKTLPVQFRLPWVIQLITLTIGCATMTGLMGLNVYGFGTGVICAALSTTFYDLALSALEAKVRAIFGTPSTPSVNTIPTTINPGPNQKNP